MKYTSLLLKLFVGVGSIALAAFCLVGYKSQQIDSNSFPQDLMYNGSPIHPSCIVSTQFGDSFRLEPKLITYTTAMVLQEYDYIVHSDVCTFNPETKTVTARCEYSIFDRDAECSEESYEYIGSYKNKHIIITRHHDSSGTGRFSELGLITRCGDTVCNAGEITGGDRAYGGVIDVVSCKDNILRFNQIAPGAEMRAIVPHDGDDYLPSSCLSQALWFVYEVNLDDPKLTPIFCGISFFDKQDYDLRYVNGNAEECFYRLAQESIDAGKQTLNAQEAEVFVKNVWQSIAALEHNMGEDEILA